MPDSSLDPLFSSAGQKYGIDPGLLKAVAQVESGGNVGTPDSYQGAQGVMQMLPATAAAMGASDPRDPAQAIPAAAAYLAQGFQQTGDAADAIRFYHGGPDRRQWGPKTEAYVAKVQGAYAALKGTPMAGQTDPYADLIKEYTGAPAPAAPPPAPQTAAPAADPYGDLIQEYTRQPVSEAPGVSFAPEPAAAAAPAAAQPASAPANPIGVNDAVRAAATGVPVVGGALNKADAALDAALAPVLNRLFSPADQLKGSTFGERYKNALTQQNGMDASFEAQHPTANMLLNTAGAVGGTIPAMAAAPAAFGATEAGLVPNLLLGAAGGAAVGGADAAVRSGGDPTAAKTGAMFGAGFGAAGPVLGAGASASVNKLTNALLRTTPAARNIADRLADAGMSAGDAQNALTRIGPSATLADVDPAMTTEAGGLAQLGGKPTSILKNAMAARGAQADNRVSVALDQALGPKPDLTAAQEAIYDQAQQSASPFYSAARASAQPMDISPVLSKIDAASSNAVGGEAKVLSTIKSYLTDRVQGPGGDMLVPKSDPQALLKARQGLDDYIQKLPIAETTAGRNALRTAAGLRSDLDAVLKGDPNIAAGDAAYASQMRLKDAMNNGLEVFTKGVRPEDFSRSVAAMSPEELSATQQGARVAIGDALEQARRGELAGAQSMFARASANRAKLDTLFPNAGDVFDMLNGEAAMRATENAVSRGSQTAQNQAVRERYQPSGSNPLSAAPAVVGEAVGGGAGAVAGMALRHGYSAVSNALTSGARNRLIEGSARALAATGPEQTAVLSQLARAASANAGGNALAKIAGNASNLLVRSTANPLLLPYRQGQR